MIHHSHHIQVPPPHQHHVIVSVKNYRKEVLNCSKTKVGRKCIAIIIPLAVLLAILYFGLKFLSGPGDLGQTLSGANDFSPYTSIMFPVSGLYCDSYSMTKYSGSPVATLSWNASMYILKDIPKLSTRHNFSVHREDQDVITLKPGEFYQWSFILHIGSRYEINSCVLGGSDNELLVIRGEAVFNEWVVAGGCSGCRRYYLQPCNLTTEQNLAHTISTDDKYYFVYLSSRTNRKVSHIQVSMLFTMLEYSMTFNETDINFIVSTSAAVLTSIMFVLVVCLLHLMGIFFSEQRLSMIIVVLSIGRIKSTSRGHVMLPTMLSIVFHLWSLLL